MRCKIHPYETGVGVCATCLRERLLALLEAHSSPSTDAAAAHFHSLHHRCRKTLPQPPHPPVLFPRSVSPYLSQHRRSSADYDARRRRLCRQFLFFSSPQVGPTATAVDCFPAADSSEISQPKQKFSLLKSLFRTPSRSSVSDHDTKRSSWLSSFSIRWRRRTSPTVCRRPSDRGMSPAEIAGDGSGSDSGYSSDSSVDRRRRLPGPTPLRPPMSSTPSHNRPRYHPRDLSSFTLCLSPLVRPSPSCQRRSHASDGGLSGDIRGGSTAGAAVLAPNRSRKLTDLSRFR